MFDWVTKAKRNIALFRSVNPSMLIAQVYPKPLTVDKPKECVSVSIPDVYIKLPVLVKTKRGKNTTKQVMKPIAAHYYS